MNIWESSSVLDGSKHISRKKKRRLLACLLGDWIGNDHADIQAKAGCETHGYTSAQKYAIERNIELVRRIQKHMISNYTKTKYKNPLVRTNAEENKKVKGTQTGAVGRLSILPIQLGHDVKTCGDNGCCLGCGRNTKDKHIDTATHVS